MRGKLGVSRLQLESGTNHAVMEYDRYEVLIAVVILRQVERSVKVHVGVHVERVVVDRHALERIVFASGSFFSELQRKLLLHIFMGADAPRFIKGPLIHRYDTVIDFLNGIVDHDMLTVLAGERSTHANAVVAGRHANLLVPVDEADLE